MILQNCIETLIRREHLTQEMCEKALHAISEASANPLQIAAFLVLLRAKPETSLELATIIKTLQEKMIRVKSTHKILDIVGTGGDGARTVNISTASAILAASCGVKIAKHGNRAVSSLAGSADVLEALGLNIHLTPEQIAKSIDEIGIGFCYAPNFHPLTLHMRELRKALKVPTIFNLIGPFLNPASAKHFILGVMHEHLMPKMAEVLAALDCERSLIVHAYGIDEISTLGPAALLSVKNKADVLRLDRGIHQIEKLILDPKEFGLSRCQLSDLQGGDAKKNALLLRAVFNGQKNALADTLTLNAAVALYIYGAYPTMKESFAKAQENLRDGAALKLLNNWIEFSHAQ